jgi:hypothetical protein
MVVRVDFERYAKKLLKRLEKQLKESKHLWEKEELKIEIEHHKQRYPEYL